MGAVDATLFSAMAAAVKAGEPLPLLPEGLGVDEAYDLLSQFQQQAFGEGPAGFKAGVTNPDIQAMLGLESPLLGYLYPWGQVAEGATLTSKPGLQIECELGVVVDAEGQPRALVPTLEFVRVAFDPAQQFATGHLVLGNLGADRFMAGPSQPWTAKTLAALADEQIRVHRDGQLLLEVPLFASLDGPVNAHRWMMQEASTRGLRLSSGGLLMTGTCGEAVAAEPGAYEVSFGSLGSLRVTLG